MIRYLRLAAPSMLRHHASLYILATAGAALGVAALVAILLVNQSALAAFTGSTEAVSGQTDLAVLPKGPTLDETTLPTVLGSPGVADAFPILRRSVAVLPSAEVQLDVFGLDLFRPLPLTVVADVDDARGWQGIGVTKQLADRQDWALGDSIALASGRGVEYVTIQVLLDDAAAPLPSRFTAIMDIGEMQRRFGQPGAITQIDVVVDSTSAVASTQAALASRLAGGVSVETPSGRANDVAELLRAFRLNLIALSLVSIIVGAFLIYAAVRASLARRRKEFGVLRALGATRRQVLLLILSEVAVLSGAGVAIGAVLGTLLAKANVSTVSATLSNLYLLNAIERVDQPAWIYLVAGATGLAAALAGALGPAAELARHGPRELLSAVVVHEQLRSHSARLAVLGLAILVLIGGWYTTAGADWQPAGFVLAFGLLAALPLMTPFVIQRVTGAARARDFSIQYSARSLGTKLQVTSIAVAALAIAVALLVGVTVMIGSFRRTLDVWLATAVQADVYIATPAWARSASDPPIDDAMLAALHAAPDIVAIDRLRAIRSSVEGRQTTIVAVDFSEELPASRFPLYASTSTTFDDVRDGAALITEPLARKRDRWVGDSIAIATAGGRETVLPIAGVYYDYSSEHGMVAISPPTMQALFGDLPVANVGLYLARNADPETTIQWLSTNLSDRPLVYRSQQRLRRDALAIFDQTFAVTKILQSLSLLIAAAGITLTLLVIARERLGELALYRALGAQRLQVFSLFMQKGLGMAGLATVLGTVGGIALAAILVFIINRAFFGWTIQLSWPYRAVAWQWAAILGAAVLASLYPALIASRASGSALREEEA